MAGKSVEDIIRYQAARGDFGPTDDVERTVKERRAMMLTPGGVRYERKTVSGRHIEFNYQPLADGGLLGVHRDITEIKEREQAVEQARSIMQSVLDNMSDGVTLFDSDYRLKFTNQRLVDFLKLPPEAVEPGLSLLDILRYQAKRGDFGPVEEAEKLARARFEFITKPGGCYFERRTADGRHLEFRFIPLRERRHHRGHARHHRAEGPRAGARHLQGGGRDRARRGRAHAPDHADGVRQSGRRRFAVRQGFPLGVQQPPPPRAAWLHAGQDPAGRFRA